MDSADYRQMLNGLVDAALVADRYGVITLANAAAAKLFGTPTAELEGTPLESLLPREQADGHDTIFIDTAPDALEAYGAPIEGVQHPVSACHGGGTSFDVRVATSRLDRDVYLVMVTPLVAAAAASNTHLEILRQLTEPAVDATVVIDEAGVIRGYNSAAETTFGYSADMVLGQNVSMLMPEEYSGEHDSHLGRYLSESRSDENRAVGMRRPVVAKTSTGVMVPVRIALSHVKLSGRHYFVGSATRVETGPDGTTAEVVNDLIERRTRALREQRDEFERLSSIDALTQLANRREFDRTLERELRRGRRADAPTALMMLDLDHFKLYNDHYGHKAGDECLQTLARIINQVFRRGTDLTARYGGEEFAVVMGATNFPTAMMLAERLVEAVVRANVPHAKSPTASHVTISVGVTAVAPGEDTEAGQMVEWADGALYEAKRSGRNRANGVDHGGDTSLTGISLAPAS